MPLKLSRRRLPHRISLPFATITAARISDARERRQYHQPPVSHNMPIGGDWPRGGDVVRMEMTGSLVTSTRRYRAGSFSTRC
jgi:hypothetical protein